MRVSVRDQLSDVRPTSTVHERAGGFEEQAGMRTGMMVNRRRRRAEIDSSLPASKQMVRLRHGGHINRF
jgi:hypothetical protein